MPSLADRSLETMAQLNRLERLWAFWPFAEGRARDTISALIEELTASPDWSEDQETSFLACASTTWPVRQAVRQYAEAHPEVVWELTLARVLPTTKVLLLRLHEREEIVSLPEILRSPLATFALHDKEREELRLLQPWLEAELWSKYKKEISPIVNEWVEDRERRATILHGKTPSNTEWSAFEREMVEG